MNSNREVIGAGATVHGGQTLSLSLYTHTTCSYAIDLFYFIYLLLAVSRASTPVAIQESSWKTENSHGRIAFGGISFFLFICSSSDI